MGDACGAAGMAANGAALADVAEPEKPIAASRAKAAMRIWIWLLQRWPEHQRLSGTGNSVDRRVSAAPELALSRSRKFSQPPVEKKGFNCHAGCASGELQ